MSNLSRLTLFAIISSMEEDLRDTIKILLAPQKSLEELFEDDLYSKCVARLNSDKDLTRDEDLFQLIDYLDFGDSFQLLNRNKSLLPKDYSNHLLGITKNLEKLIPIRNRVMHTRPLMFDDLAITSESATKFVSQKQEKWKLLKETLNKLKSNPSYVLGLVIPPTNYSNKTTNHNLPLPDFDETGFLGRTKQVDDLIKACFGPFPIITIVGEGGIGKTALAIKVAYEIVDLENTPFHYVVWTSSKTSQITVQEITRIEGAIKDSVGLIQSVANELGAIGEPLEEVIEYLTQFKILLILDNLETVLDERIRSFLQALPIGSKVLITSRIGLGSLEYPIRLREMDNSESVQLLRALAVSRNVEQLVKVNNDRLSNFCNRMKNNPGYIKWFVSAVQAGKRPEEVLAKPDMFLEFCMSNVYEYLSDDSRSVLKAMQIVPSDLSQAELVFLTEMDETDLQKSLQELLTTNMVNMTSTPIGSSYQSTYKISDLARPYLSKEHPASASETKRITGKKQILNNTTQEIKRDTKENPYSFDSININSNSDLIVAKYLKDSMVEVKKRNFLEAEAFIKSAKKLAPEYYEVHRVEAFINDRQEKFGVARSSYEAAIELEPNSAPLRMWFGQFLFRRFQDIEEAQKQLLFANTLDPENFNIESEIARLNIINGDYEPARTIIKKLITRADLSALERKKIFGVKLRFHKEAAEIYLSRRDTKFCLDELESLIKTYIEIPKSILDYLMKKELGRAIPIAYSLNSLFRFHEMKNKNITLVIDFLHKHSGGPRRVSENTVSANLTQRPQFEGIVDRIVLDYGFIKTTHERFFFHFDDLIDCTSVSLVIGMKVFFEIGTNTLGQCARNVKISN
jgi:LuxR family transcriptional regulator, glucitol operon activator